MTLELASITDVTEVRSGSELSADFPVGTKVPSVYLTIDYSDEGGQVEIDGDVYDYDTKDDEAGTITLVNGLLRDMPADTEVWVYPDDTAKMAGVEIDGEADEARVPHNLEGAVEAMVRDNYDQESVVLEWTGRGWVIKDIIAVEYKIQPEAIDQESLANVDVGGGGPTEPPASSPTITTTGFRDAITVEARGVIDPTTILDYYIDGVLAESTHSPLMLFRSDAAGVQLQPDTEYLFHVVARNEIDSAPPSPQVVGMLNAAVDSETVLGIVKAGFALVGGLGVGNISIRPPSGTPGTDTYDSGGIVIPLTSGGEIRFPADGSPAIIEAILRTADLAVSGGLSINGITNYLNGKVYLGSGTPNPVQPTGISSGRYSRVGPTFENTSHDNEVTWARGLARTTNGHYGIIAPVPNTARKKLLIFDSARNFVAFHDSDDVGTDMMGVTAVGNTFYVVGVRWNANSAQSEWRIHTFSTAASGGHLGGRWIHYEQNGSRIASATYYGMAIAADPGGNHVWVARCQSNGKIKFMRYGLTGDDQYPSDWLLSEDLGCTFLSGAFYVGNGDLTAINPFRWFIAGQFSSTFKVVAVDYNTGLERTADSWDTGSGYLDGLIYDATAGKFIQLDVLSEKFTLTDVNSTKVDTTVYAQHAWYDTNPDGGHKESAPSPIASKVIPKRFWPILTVPAPPKSGTGEDQANAVKVFLDTDNTTKWLETVTTGQAASIIATAMAGTGDPPLAASTFTAASATGALESLLGNISLKGDGSWKLGDILGALTGRHTYPSVSLTASGSYTRGIDLVRIGQLVFATGDVDRPGGGFNASFHTTGLVVPVGFRPASNVLTGYVPNSGATQTHRARYNTDGTVEIQQTGAITSFMNLDAMWVTADA